MRIRDGPAAVTEQNREAFCRSHCSIVSDWSLQRPVNVPTSEKASFATARESEDLPTRGMWLAARDGRRERLIFNQVAALRACAHAHVVADARAKPQADRPCVWHCCDERASLGAQRHHARRAAGRHGDHRRARGALAAGGAGGARGGPAGAVPEQSAADRRRAARVPRRRTSSSRSAASTSAFRRRIPTAGNWPGRRSSCRIWKSSRCGSRSTLTRLRQRDERRRGGDGRQRLPLPQHGALRAWPRRRDRRQSERRPAAAPTIAARPSITAAFTARRKSRRRPTASSSTTAP